MVQYPFPAVRRALRLAVIIAIILLGSGRSAAADAGGPVITLTDSGAIATGIRPGGDAIWYFRSVTEFSGWPRLSRVLKVTRDDDRDGIVSIQAAIPPASVVFVIDFATGQFSMVTPDGTPVRELNAVGNGWGGGVGHLDFGVSDLEILLVRPGRGAYTMRSEQGGANDADNRSDANLRIRLSDMIVIHGSENPPPVAVPHDLLIAIEPTQLLTFVRAARENRP